MANPNTKTRIALHRRGVLRVEEPPGGRASIEVVRIVNRRIQKRTLPLTAEEFRALNEIFGRTEAPGAQLSLDLPEEEKPELVIPLPRGPSHAKPRRFYFARRGEKRG